LICIKEDRQRALHVSMTMEEIMPVTDAAILCVIVAAFAVFALTLAWGDYRTRNIRPIIGPATPKANDDRPQTRLTPVKRATERTAA
jgi:hypothetical protein